MNYGKKNWHCINIFVSDCKSIGVTFKSELRVSGSVLGVSVAK